MKRRTPGRPRVHWLVAVATPALPAGERVICFLRIAAISISYARHLLLMSAVHGRIAAPTGSGPDPREEGQDPTKRLTGRLPRRRHPGDTRRMRSGTPHGS